MIQAREPRVPDPSGITDCLWVRPEQAECQAVLGSENGVSVLLASGMSFGAPDVVPILIIPNRRNRRVAPPCHRGDVQLLARNRHDCHPWPHSENAPRWDG